jgi:hypothetical protein
VSFVLLCYHPISQEARDRAGALLQHHYSRIILYQQWRGFKAWRRFSLAVLRYRYTGVCLTIQRWVRGFLGRQAARAKKAARPPRKVRDIAAAWQKTDAAARKMQRAARGFLFGRMLAHHLKRREWAAGVLQRYVRCHAWRWRIM